LNVGIKPELVRRLSLFIKPLEVAVIAFIAVPLIFIVILSHGQKSLQALVSRAPCRVLLLLWCSALALSLGRGIWIRCLYLGRSGRSTGWNRCRRWRLTYDEWKGEWSAIVVDVTQPQLLVRGIIVLIDQSERVECFMIMFFTHWTATKPQSNFTLSSVPSFQLPKSHVT
jgi:hypothetical protein